MNSSSGRDLVASPYAELVSGLLREGRAVRVPLRGGSMRWTLVVAGDLLVSPAGRLSRGRIYVYRKNDGLVAHRLVRFAAAHPDLAWFRGENAAAPLEAVARDSIVGEVTAQERQGHWQPVNGFWPRMQGWLWIVSPWAARRWEQGRRRAMGLVRNLGGGGERWP